MLIFRQMSLKFSSVRLETLMTDDTNQRAYSYSWDLNWTVSLSNIRTTTRRKKKIRSFSLLTSLPLIDTHQDRLMARNFFALVLSLFVSLSFPWFSLSNRKSRLATLFKSKEMFWFSWSCFICITSLQVHIRFLTGYNWIELNRFLSL